MIIDEKKIMCTLEKYSREDRGRIAEILEHAREAKGLEPDEVAQLVRVEDPLLLEKLFSTAREVKEKIYGKRLVLFAPLYISNMCANECLYCAFRARNRKVERRALTQPLIRREVEALVDQGHKRILLVAGEAYPENGFDYILESIETVYSVKKGNGEIRRVNVNVAPLDVEEFRRLKEAKIGTYQLFQETYHRETYEKIHLGGPKRDYDWRITCMDRAMEAGISDVGIGVLFGLFDWRFEILALLEHIKHLEKEFGTGPHTISVPRLEPATNSELASNPPYPVSDMDFKKIVALLRLAVPYTGIIMSTRETAEIRRETFALGVSQISAGSRTNPGGYSDREIETMSQFSLGDHRSLDEVVEDIARLGYIPSFCTSCYRAGRVGADFMELAKPGDIKMHCDPNALATFCEYLIDYASPKTRKIGEKLIEDILNEMEDRSRAISMKLLERIRSGKRDIYV